MPTTSSMWLLWACMSCSSSSNICSMSYSWSVHRSSTSMPYLVSSWASVFTFESNVCTSIVFRGTGCDPTDVWCFRFLSPAIPNAAELKLDLSADVWNCLPVFAKVVAVWGRWNEEAFFGEIIELVFWLFLFCKPNKGYGYFTCVDRRFDAALAVLCIDVWGVDYLLRDVEERT